VTFGALVCLRFADATNADATKVGAPLGSPLGAGVFLTFGALVCLGFEDATKVGICYYYYNGCWWLLYIHKRCRPRNVTMPTIRCVSNNYQKIFVVVGGGGGRIYILDVCLKHNNN
jgi:hypothetical protein